MPHQEETSPSAGIAVTGLSCRFSGEGSSPKAFWDSLCRKESAWSEIPKDRFDRRAFGHKIPQGAHFLQQDIAAFDGPFFSITAAEARAMDPQQRMILEVVYEALESAGYPLPSLRGSRTGVFMGQLTSDYQELVCRDIDSVMNSKHSLTGLQRTSLANRISWLFDLKGPSFTLDTACSSSLTALHLACESLSRGECDTAIVGGVNVIINPDMFICLGGQGFLAPDGKCKAFDASGNGYGRGEGVGAVVLRRVGDAVDLGDPLRSVIRGTGNNQDGHTKGFTLPSAEAQAALIREVYGRAGLDMGRTSYVEAHGTGTKAGDLEETTGIACTLSRALGTNRKILIGSVKTNIGHLEAGAGIAAVIKSTLMLEAGMIPPNVHFHNPNPAIKFDEWNLSVPTEMMPWPSQDGHGPDQVRRISINSFGYGGANSHAIMDDAKSFLTQHSHVTANKLNGHPPTSAAGPYLFALSAQDKEGIDRVKKSLGSFLRSTKSENPSHDESQLLQSLAYTLNERRTPLQWKTYTSASTLEDLIESLDPQTTSDSPSPAPRFLSSRPPNLGFVFTGQGAQWATMGIRLLDRFPVFRASVEAADLFLRHDLECGWSAIQELSRGKSTTNLAGAEYSQALCTVLQVALLDLLRHWGITPRAVVGHSSGEIAAAYAWGVLSREDAWRVAYHRGVLSSRLRQDGLEGAMMAIGASADEVEGHIAELQASLTEDDGEVHIACINSPHSVTASGDVGAIDKLQSLLHEQGLFARKLLVDTAYHSPHMEVMAPEYFSAIADIKRHVPTDPTIKMFSSVTGAALDASELGPAYWIRNAVSPVQFCAAIQNLVRDSDSSIDILVEVGPHSALLGPATQSLKAVGVVNMPYHSMLMRFQDSVETALALAGTLFARGVPPKFANINRVSGDGPPPPVRTDLPPYPWNHAQKLWQESRIGREYRLRAPVSTLLGAAHPSAVAGEYVWRGFIRLSDELWASWLPDHKISGSVVCPGAGFVAMAIEAARSLAATSGGQGAVKEPSGVRLRDVNLISALVVAPEEDVEYMVSLRPFISSVRDTTAVWNEFTVTSCRNGGALEKNCAGLILLEFHQDEHDDTGLSAEAQQVATDLCTTVVKPADLYESLSTAGLQLGSTFRNLTTCQIGLRQSCSTVVVPDVGFTNLAQPELRPHVIHPVVLDTIFQTAFSALLVENSKALTTAMVPKVIDDIFIATDIPFQAASRLTGFANAERYGFKEIMADITMFAEGGARPVLQVSGFCCSEVAGAASGGGAEQGAAEGARSLLSKIVRLPALNLISDEKLLAHLTRDVSDSDVSTGPADGVLRSIRKYIQLMHHSKPDLSVVEVIPGSEISSVLVNIVPHISDVLATSEATIWCKDDASKEQLAREVEKTLAVHEVEVPRIEVRDIKSTKTDSVTTDFALLSFVQIPGSTTSAEILDMAREASNTLSSNGRLCLVVSEAIAGELVAQLGKKYIRVDVPTSAASIFFGPKLTEPVNGVHTTNGVSHQGSEDKHVTILLSSSPSAASKAVAKSLSAKLSGEGYEPSLVCWCGFGSTKGDEALSYITDRKVVSLLELDQAVLVHPENDMAFSQLKKLVLDSQSLLWVSGTELDSEPTRSMVLGLTRSVRNEEPGLVVQALQIIGWEANNNAVKGEHDDVSGSILKIFESSQSSESGNPGHQDNEFFLVDGLIHIDRITEDTPLNTTLNQLLNPSTYDTKLITRLPLSQTNPIKLTVQNAGLLDTLIFEPDPLPLTALAPDDVEITVHASSLNFRDVMTTMGHLPGTALGFDCAGVVRRVAPGITKVRVGDRVAMIQPGSHRTVHRAKVECVERIPDSMTFAEAATIPVVHGTAWYALVKLAQARRGQSVLIHAAAGGVGQAAIMLALHLGLQVFATVGSAEKRALLVDKYGLPDEHIFNSRDASSFVAGVRLHTQGRGVDIILNSLSGEALRQTWYCIAPFGTFIEIGIKDILGNARLDMKPFNGSTTFTFFDINRIIRERRDIMGDIMAGVFDLQRRGITSPVAPLAVYPAADLENAFRLMQTGRHLGKIVLSFEDDTQVLPVLTHRQLPPQLQAPRLDPEAVYILAGGLGGLGRSLARMLVDDMGATKICFLSRSGATSDAARKTVAELQSRPGGVQVLALPCDIADESAVRSAVQAAKKQMAARRVGGVLQCAMVLRDTLFRNMSRADWVECTRPKVQGTWNLHTVLSEEQQQPAEQQPFFVTLSSFAALFGNRGQTNYAAAGAYQDALAQYLRRSRKLRAVTIDVGLMRDIGVLAEQGMVAGLGDWEKPYGIREHELLGIVKLAVAGDVPPQLVTGLATGGSAVKAGIERPWYLDCDGRFAVMAASGMKQAAAAAAAETGAGGRNGGGESVPAQLAAAESKADAVGIITTALVARLAKTLQTTASEIDTERFLHSYGIDSLSAIELVNWALKECKSRITMFDVMAAVPISATARKIADLSKLVAQESAA